MATKSKVILRNDSGSPITVGSLTFTAGQSHVIWNTTQSSEIALENFAAILEDYNALVTELYSGNLVWNQGGVDQSYDIAIFELGPIITEYVAYTNLALGMQTIPSPDNISNQHGGILFHGQDYYEKLGPGNVGEVLASQGPGQDVVWLDLGLDGYVLDLDFQNHITDTTIHFTAESLGLDGYALDSDFQNHVNDLTIHFNPESLGLDGYATTTHSSTHESGGSDELDGYQVALNYVPQNYSVTDDIIGEHIAAIDEVLGVISKRKQVVQFALSENVNNTTEWFFLWSSDTNGGRRSSSSTGMQNANGCSPYIVPFNATITKAILVVRGVGVQNGTVTYPVTYQTDLMDVGFTSETTISSVNFSISNSYTVGTFGVGATNFRGSSDLSIDVDENDTIGLKFINGTGASLAGQTRMAFITLILEER